jgi:DNA-binding Xre family transcriptional regulator
MPACAGMTAERELKERQKKNPHRGSTLESYLREEGVYEEVTLRAIKSVLAWRISEMMKKQRITKSQMAKRMKTSRTAVDRLLDSENTLVTLQTMGRAAAVLGKELTIGLRDAT